MNILYYNNKKTNIIKHLNARRQIMKYLNLLGFIVCVVVMFLPEKYRLLLIIPAFIFIVSGVVLIMNETHKNNVK